MNSNTHHRTTFLPKLFGGVMLFVCMSLPYLGAAQVLEVGSHFGYGISKFGLDENKLSDAIFIKTGKPFASMNVGGQLLVSPPRDQSTSYLRFRPSVLFEATLCRCGGYMDLSLTSLDGTRSFNELKYILYRGEYSAKFVVNFGLIQFMAGPTVSNRFYSGVQLGTNAGQKFAGDQFKVLAFAYELGMGIKLNKIHLSTRFQRFINGYGRESVTIPTVFKHHQVRFMLSYFFLKKERGKNWDSIHWD